MKPLLGVIVLALAAWLFYAMLRPPAESAESGPPPGGWTSSQQCQECHTQVYAEWVDSWHARSWVDEDVRAQSENFANVVCIDCHAPRPIFSTGIGERVLPRSSRRHEGVDCLTCHLLPDGSIAGTMDRPDAPCKPVARRELAKVEACASCHDQHFTVRQWRETPFAERGEGCISCHMPYRDGNPSKGRLHTMIGGHDLGLVASAVALRAQRRADGKLQVEVENVFGAHSFPTDERSRASDVFWRPLPEDRTERGGWRHLHRIRDPYRSEVDIPSTLLHAGELRTLELDPGPVAGPIEVGLFYKLTPYYRDPGTGLALETESVQDPLIDADLLHAVVVE